jgi:hypothetical protein
VTSAGSWRRCSSCKGEIAFGSRYYVCNVSTCNQKRTGLAFCSVSCWEAHVPVLRHRESWAVEKQAPRAGDAPPERPPERRDILVRPATPARPAAEALPREVLVVTSKLKQYVRARSGFNTSDRVADVLSDVLRELCDGAIDRARAEGRRTVMERDFEEP